MRIKIIENWKVRASFDTLKGQVAPEDRFIRLHGFSVSTNQYITCAWIVEVKPPHGEWCPDDEEPYRIMTLSGSCYILGEPYDDRQWDKLVAYWARLSDGAVEFGYVPTVLEYIRRRGA